MYELWDVNWFSLPWYLSNTFLYEIYYSSRVSCSWGILGAQGMTVGLGQHGVSEWGGYSRGLCEVMLCQPSKAVCAAWACCFQACVEGRVAPWWCALCLREKVARLCGRNISHFQKTDILCMFMLNCGGHLADTSVSYPDILLSAFAFCAAVAFRYWEIRADKCSTVQTVCAVLYQKTSHQGTSIFCFPGLHK